MLQIDYDKPLFFDVETTLDKVTFQKVLLAQFYQEGWDDAYVLIEPEREEIAKITEGTHIVGHNISFDLHAALGPFYKHGHFKKIDDTLILSRLRYPTLSSYSLDSVLEYIGIKYEYTLSDFELARLGLKSKKDFSKSFDRYYKKRMMYTKAQIEYAKQDVILLSKLYNKVKTNTFCYNLDIEVLSQFVEQAKYGVPILKAEAYKMREELENKRAELEAKLPFNPYSPKQVCEYYGFESSAEDYLLDYLDVRGVKELMEARSIRKLISSYLDKFLEPKFTGRIAPTAVSGRTRSNNNNLQNIPRQFKKLIGFETDDRLILSADFNALELRCIAALAPDYKMIEAFQSGESLHDITATAIFGPDFTPEQRMTGKTVTFSSLYGGKSWVVKKALQKQGYIVSEQEAKELQKAWKAKWAGIVAWQNRQREAFRAGKLGEVPDGRKFLPKLETDMMAVPNQGFGATVAKLAYNYIYKNLPKDVYIINFIHDDFWLSLPNDKHIAYKTAKIVSDAMQKAWNEGAKLVPNAAKLTMPVEVEIGKSLKDIYYLYIDNADGSKLQFKELK